MRNEADNLTTSSARRTYWPLPREAVKNALTGSIKFYRQWISPAFPPSCRFYPTCSAYALEAVEKYGPLKGSWMGLKRILRCHPWNPGGFDPVP